MLGNVFFHAVWYNVRKELREKVNKAEETGRGKDESKVKWRKREAKTGKNKRMNKGRKLGGKRRKYEGEGVNTTRKQ